MGFLRQRWFLVLVVGGILFLATEQALRMTGNPNFFPTVLLIGAFVVPISFVTYIFQRERRLDIHPDSPLLSATLSFVVGGTIGVIVAGVLEYKTLTGLSVGGLIFIGLVEEAAKLIFPVFCFYRARFREEMDGILFGAAAGMGFASLETMGYGLVSFVKSSGDINVLDQVLLARGLLSPVGHAAWTALVCAVLWRQREWKGGGLFSLAATGAFITAVVLHILWDLSNSASSLGVTILGNLAIATVSLVLLVRRLREARRHPKENPVKSGG